MKHWKTYSALLLLVVAGCASQPPGAYENAHLVGSASGDFQKSYLPSYYAAFPGFNGRRVKGYDDGYNYGGYPQFIDWNDSQYYHLSYNSLEGYRYK